MPLFTTAAAISPIIADMFFLLVLPANFIFPVHIVTASRFARIGLRIILVLRIFLLMRSIRTGVRGWLWFARCLLPGIWLWVPPSRRIFDHFVLEHFIDDPACSGTTGNH